MEEVSKTITVVIAGRPYPLRVKEEDEEAIRKIVKEVNDKVNHFQLTYTDRDKQDHLAMVTLTFAVELYKTRQNQRADRDQTLATKLGDLHTLLDRLLAQ